MKPTSNFLIVILGCAIVALVLSTWPPQTPAAALAPAPAQEACDRNRSIQVSGTAVIYVTPDRALLQMGVQSNGATPDEARSANHREIQQVINAVRALGVEAKDIATDYYIVYPVYEDYNSLVIKGYRIDNTVSVTLRDVSLAGDAIVAALKAGANEVQDVQFYTSQLREYRDQARAMAVKAAGEKAQALASAAGAQAGCVISVSENTWSHYYGSWRGGRQTALWTQNVAMNASPSQEMPALSEDSPISLGQILVQAEVSASYSLK
jgi:uncharacterized protein YggE